VGVMQHERIVAEGRAGITSSDSRCSIRP
jgi:hypothetical protein